LIVENYSEYDIELEQALSFLEKYHKINGYVSEEFEGLGFVNIFFSNEA